MDHEFSPDDAQLYRIVKSEISLGDSGTVHAVLHAITDSTSLDYLQECIKTIRYNFVPRQGKGK